MSYIGEANLQAREGEVNLQAHEAMSQYEGSRLP